MVHPFYIVPGMGSRQEVRRAPSCQVLCRPGLRAWQDGHARLLIATEGDGTEWVRHLLDAELPVRYGWDFDEAAPDRVCAIALGPYQLGRGVDMAVGPRT